MSTVDKCLLHRIVLLQEFLFAKKAKPNIGLSQLQDILPPTPNKCNGSPVTEKPLGKGVYRGGVVTIQSTEGGGGGEVGKGRWFTSATVSRCEVHYRGG